MKNPNPTHEFVVAPRRSLTGGGADIRVVHRPGFRVQIGDETISFADGLAQLSLDEARQLAAGGFGTIVLRGEPAPGGLVPNPPAVQGWQNQRGPGPGPVNFGGTS